VYSLYITSRTEDVSRFDGRFDGRRINKLLPRERVRYNLFFRSGFERFGRLLGNRLDKVFKRDLVVD